MFNRRLFLKSTTGLWAGSVLLPRLSWATTPASTSIGPPRPLSVYINWAAYDELSDKVRLTEKLALDQLTELIRLKKTGVQVDYYLMDAFWFDMKGGYRAWRKPDWPQGPDRWINDCQSAAIKPGLWVSTNVLHAGGKYILEAPKAWQSSLTRSGKSLCLFSGGYLAHFMETLQQNVDKGIRLFKFDFADFGAVTPALEKTMSAADIGKANKKALKEALMSLRQRNPDILLMAYNGFGGKMSNTGIPILQTVDTEWLEVFDTMYCGDPRPADVPAMNFWRSKDIYSDHMVHYFEANGLPAYRIDNSGFMIGKTGTCYYRGNAAWKGMLLLSLARGGWLNTYYGNLELLTDADARWFAKAQQLWLPMQQTQAIKPFGGVPGQLQPYGYAAKSSAGTLVCVVNPTQAITDVELPGGGTSAQRILFTDAGFVPVVSSGSIRLGPEQMALVGQGDFSDPKYDLGVGEDVRIPNEIRPIEMPFAQVGNRLTGSLLPPAGVDLRLVFQQFDTDGIPLRSSGGAPPDGKLMDQLLSIRATQGGQPIPLSLQYDKAIWSGLSWAVAEIDKADIQTNQPVQIEFTTTDRAASTLRGVVYAVQYQQ